MNKHVKAGLVVGIWLGAIIAANLISARWGADASVYNAFFLVGLAITTRDYLHDLWHEHRVRNMEMLIIGGSALSYGASIALASDALPSELVARIALASLVAFAVAETMDALSYHALRRREWLERSNASNFVSATLDSVIFVSIAFGFTFEIVALQILAKVAGGLAFSLILKWIRRDDAVRDIPAPVV
jgi:uncharacterized PurR-regulated membrane protein YhhQ (DUF165 family)